MLAIYLVGGNGGMIEQNIKNKKSFLQNGMIKHEDREMVIELAEDL